jgi:membrane-associated protease RseP (regulator of RpoE activity)
MRKQTIIFALIATVAGATGIVAAAPRDQKQSDAPPPRDTDDVHVTVSAGRGRLGFVALEISPELRKHLGAPADRGVLVDKVRPDSPAARAGLRVGDVILEVDAQAARSASDIIHAISDRKKGETIPIFVARGKDRVTLQATLDDEPGPRLQGSGDLDDQSWERFGPGEAPFGMKQLFEDRNLRRALEDVRKRLDQLEHRLDAVDHRGSTTKPTGPTAPNT